MNWIFVAVVCVVVERLTEILTSSKISAPVRDLLRTKAYGLGVESAKPSPARTELILRWVDELVNCGYCTSVWVSAVFSLAVTIPITDYSLTNWFLTTMLVHGGSNLTHVLYELIRKGRIRTYDVMLTRGQASGKVGCGNGQGGD